MTLRHLLLILFFLTFPHHAAAWNDEITGMEFVKVPAGCFKIGNLSRDEIDNAGKSTGEICVEAFYIGKYEVTNAQFRNFNREHDSGSYNGDSLNSCNQPVVNVSWNDAVKFAQWLSRETGRVFRLPTEIEWEYAARGGATDRNYYGDGVRDVCGYTKIAEDDPKLGFSISNNCTGIQAATSEVGSSRPNGFGLYDMVGNAWEWSGEWFKEDYAGTPPPESRHTGATGSDLTDRCGCWYDGIPVVRAAIRYNSTLGYRNFNLGFRLVSPLDQTPQ
ncbi:MAG: SUMF1/EgtB/PvdO family nonheme iron enzyme [Desulfuromonadaceae bacterium]|nr:SUMF1/EgtB/PvdO family nonheme iron enzyme [Desulfuromonadaceae bacterium]MDD2856301.1 SUMF1/EgtB/PvdO family nonheme iron enzyme [Desulfuromonadaceae bacterium]